jgi:adenylate cyclase
LSRRPFASLNYYRALHGNHKNETDVDLRIEAMRMAGVPDWPYAYQPPVTERLDNNALASLTVGRTWSGATLKGQRFFQQFTDDGRVVLRNEISLLTGTAWLDDDRLCIDFPAALILREDCGYVYRNPEGTTDSQNEYVRVGLGEVFFFSVKP